MLSLADIQGAPTDLNQLTLWAQRNGHLPPPAPPPETPPLVPPATVTAQMSPVATAQPKSEVQPMSSVTGTPDASHLGGMPGSEIGGSPTAVKPMTPPDIGSSAYTRGQLQGLVDKGNNDTLSSHDTFPGKLGHIAGRIGNIAGNILVPNVMAGIPGTELNTRIKESALKGELEKRTQAEEQEESRKAQQKNLESEEGLRAVQTKEAQQHLDKESTEQALEKDTEGNIIGWHDGQGVQHSLEDPNTPQGIKEMADAAAAKPHYEKTENGDIVQITPGKKGEPSTSNVVYKGTPKTQTEIRSIVGEDGKAHDFIIDKTPNSPTFGAKLKDLGRAKEDKVPSTGQEAQRADRNYQYNNGEIDKVEKPISDRLARIPNLHDSIFAKTPQADALVAPELLSIMAGGAGSGLRMNESEIARIVGGRSNWESLKAAVNKWQLDPTKALSITDPQRAQIQKLMSTVYQRLSAKEKIISDSRRNLVDATDPKEMRSIVNDMREKLNAEDDKASQGGEGGGAKVKFGGQEYTIGADGTIDIPGKGKYKVTPGSKDLVKVK